MPKTDEATECKTGQWVIDEVVDCDLVEGHDGPHHSTVVQDKWGGYRIRWDVQWTFEDLPASHPLSMKAHDPQ